MEEVITIFVFLYGCILGSFFNVIGLRVPKKQSIIFPSSACPLCHKRLSWVELIPVCSYLFLKGRCRHCGTKISPLYPIMEAITGLLFVISYLQFGISWEFIFTLIFIALLVIITVSDLAYMIIPNRILVIFTVLFLLIRLISPLKPWWDSLVGALVGFFLLMFIAFFSRGGMGGGDIKLFFVLGLFFGTKNVLLTLFFASFLGTVYGLILIVLKKFERKKPIPFAPFITSSALIAYFYGERLIEWYSSMFLR